MFLFLSRWLVVVCLSIAVLPVFADSKAIISQCRNLSLDQSGFVECIKLLEVESGISLETIESEWIAYLQGGEGNSAETDNATIDAELDQLLSTSVSYREYRDQYCRFQVTGLDDVLMSTNSGACRIAMDRDRTSKLRSLLIEQRARRISGNFYRGYYLQANGVGLFQSCDQRQDWSVAAVEAIQQRLTERYDELTTEALEMVYVELRGVVTTSENEAVPAELQINELNLVRPLLESDCRIATVPLVSDTTASAPADFPESDAFDDTEEAAPASDTANAVSATTNATIDDLGDAGFLYGYFGAWTSMCAADSQLVCKAQSDDTFSSAGNWQLMVDRSVNGNWRVRLTPTTDSHVIGGQMQVAVDGASLFTVPPGSEQVLIGSAVTLATGNRALQLLNTMRDGAAFEISWNTPEQTSANLVFSLSGISLALQYFDNRGN